MASSRGPMRSTRDSHLLRRLLPRRLRRPRPPHRRRRKRAALCFPPAARPNVRFPISPQLRISRISRPPRWQPAPPPSAPICRRPAARTRRRGSPRRSNWMNLKFSRHPRRPLDLPRRRRRHRHPRHHRREIIRSEPTANFNFIRRGRSTSIRRSRTRGARRGMIPKPGTTGAGGSCSGAP